MNITWAVNRESLYFSNNIFILKIVKQKAKASKIYKNTDQNS